MLNLDQLQLAEEPIALTVTHPVTGEATDAVLQMLSPFHAAYQTRRKQIARDTLLQQITNTAEDEMELRLTVAAIAGWEGLLQDGQLLTYSQSAAEQLLRTAPWLQQQIVFFYTDAAKFFKNASSN